ncbi:MAG: ribosome assembly RNA-binding protein YhbY [Candidatus Electrothrix sp. YB6]
MQSVNIIAEKIENMSEEKKKKKQVVLNGKQKKFLRGLGHHLEPVVYVGKEGISENVERSVADALKARELIKVKLGQNCEVPKKEAAGQLAEVSGAALVQLIGKMVLLYLPNKKLKPDQRLTLPK